MSQESENVRSNFKQWLKEAFDFIESKASFSPEEIDACEIDTSTCADPKLRITIQRSIEEWMLAIKNLNESKPSNEIVEEIILMYPLEHLYNETSLTFDHLIGSDKFMVATLKDLTGNDSPVPLELYLTLVEENEVKYKHNSRDK